MSCSCSARWLAKNVVREIPAIGHTLVGRNCAAFVHDMKHLTGMMVGMLLMMLVPLPMGSSSLTPAESALLFLLQYLIALVLMYMGVFCVSILFNVFSSSFEHGSSKAQLTPSDLPSMVHSDSGEQEYLFELGK